MTPKKGMKQRTGQRWVKKIKVESVMTSHIYLSIYLVVRLDDLGVNALDPFQYKVCLVCYQTKISDHSFIFLHSLCTKPSMWRCLSILNCTGVNVS